MEKLTTQIRAPRDGDVGEVAYCEYDVVAGEVWIRNLNGKALQLHATLGPNEDARQVARRLVKDHIRKGNSGFNRRIVPRSTYF